MFSLEYHESALRSWRHWSQQWSTAIKILLWRCKKCDIDIIFAASVHLYHGHLYKTGKLKIIPQFFFSGNVWCFMHFAHLLKSLQDGVIAHNNLILYRIPSEDRFTRGGGGWRVNVIHRNHIHNMVQKKCHKEIRSKKQSTLRIISTQQKTRKLIDKGIRKYSGITVLAHVAF